MSHRLTCRGAVVGQGWFLDCDFPKLRLRWMADCVNGARAAVNQGARHAAIAQYFHSPADGVAFADGAEVEHHSLAREAHRAVWRVQLDVLHANPGPGCGDLFSPRHLARAAHEAPAAHE